MRNMPVPMPTRRRTSRTMYTVKDTSREVCTIHNIYRLASFGQWLLKMSRSSLHNCCPTQEHCTAVCSAAQHSSKQAELTVTGLAEHGVIRAAESHSLVGGAPQSRMHAKVLPGLHSVVEALRVHRIHQIPDVPGAHCAVVVTAQHPNESHIQTCLGPAYNTAAHRLVIKWPNTCIACCMSNLKM